MPKRTVSVVGLLQATTKRAVFDSTRQQTFLFRCLSSRGRESEKNEKRELAEEREALLSQAQQLTIRLYRHCMRSVRAIRHGNENDEKEFQDRERKREEKTELLKDPRLSMLSLLPPVDRKNELRSRAEYYEMHTNEMFSQESNCLTFPSVMERDNVSRYLHQLRYGEHSRTYLLRDMKFGDPIAAESLVEWKREVQRWQDRAELYCARKVKTPSGAAAKALEKSLDKEGDKDDDGFWTESDEDE